MAVITKKEADDFCQRISNSIELMNAVGFADMNIQAPGIGLFPDSAMFYDSSKDIIHLGYYGVLNVFQPTSEQELFSGINYVRGHEEQHRRSTANRPYAFAILSGKKAVLEYIQEQLDGYKKHFRKASEYELYANELPKKGIYIKWSQIEEFIASLTNALEDGRIERLRGNRFPGFAVLRQYFRGKFWLFTDHDYKPYDEIKNNPSEKLQIIFSQILSLATCNVFGRGFDIYEDTPLETEVRAFIPDIASAVMSGRTRGLIAPVTNISKALAPYLYEAFKASAADVAMVQALQDFINSLANQMLDAAPQGELSENKEDTDNGSMNSALPHSDLVVTLDDETFDKLKENTSESNNGGIMVKREHPENESDENNDSDNTNSAKSQTETEESYLANNTADGKTSNNDENDGNAKNNTSPSEKDHSEKTEMSAKGDETNSDDNPDNEEKATIDSDLDNLREKPHNNEASLKNKRAEKHVSNEMKKSIEDTIKNAMEEAAKIATAEADTNIAAANVLNAKCKSNAVHSKETIDNSKPISAAEMRDICDFKELHRVYKVKDRLPAVYLQRGKTLHHKNEMYFKSLSTPNVSYLDSGSIDPSRIYGLAMGDTEIFRKQGKDKKFDGCVYILIDNSGSMAGKKREEACKAASIIEEGFKGLLPFKIVAFDYNGCVVHEVVKNWDESLNQNCCWNFFRYGRSGGGNEDGFDIQIAERELLTRPEKKKMLIVLSDGTPGDTRYCKRAIESARKKGIQVHGIYFELGECRSNAQFANMYQKDYICCPLSELDNNLQKIMKKFSRS